MEAQAGDQHQRGRHHTTVRDVVLEIRVAREMLREVGRKQRLERPGKPPKVRELDEQAVPCPQRGGRDEDRNVAQLQGQRVGQCDPRLAARQEVHPPAELVDDQHERENPQPPPGPAARGDDQDHRRGSDHGKRGDMLGREQFAHTQSEPGSSHSGVTPKRAKRERRFANQR